MARKNYISRGDSILGVYPEDFERGHIPGRRGTRRVLCKKSELKFVPEAEQHSFLNDLYNKKEFELRREALDDQLKIDDQKRKRKTASFSEAAKIWLEEVAQIQSPKTHKTYKNSITIYKDSVGDHRLSEFDRAKNIKFFTALTLHPGKTKDSTIGPDTQNQHMRQLQNFLNWAYDNEYIEKRFNLKKAKVPQKDMETFTPDEVQRLADYLEEKFNEKTDPRLTRLNKNLFRAFMLARHTLVRVGHIWSLKIENIDLEAGFIRFTENEELEWKPKGMKWPNKPINKSLMKFLKEDFANRDPSERYFLDKGNGNPWHATSNNMSKLMRAACNELGLSKKVKPFHWGIRATYITWLLNEGVPPVQVQHLADHSDLTTTMKYFNTRKSSQQSAVDLLG